MSSIREWLLHPISHLIPAIQARLSDHTSRHMAIVLAGHALRLGLGLISSAALARGLGPTKLSTFSVLSAAVAIAVSVGDFGLSISAVRFIAADQKGNRPRALATARLFFFLKLLGSLVIVVAGFFLVRPLAAILHLPVGSGPVLVGLAALVVLATSTSGAVSAILQALRRFPDLVGTQTLNAFLTVLLLGGLFLSGRLNISNALLVGAGTALAAALLGWRLLPREWRPAVPSLTPRPRQETLRLWRFGRWLWIATILTILLSQLDLLLLNRWATSEATGHYALALNLALKTNILNQTLYTVLLPSASALTGREQFTAYIRRSLVRSGLLVAGLLLVLPLARPFILTVYGAEYAASIPLFQLLIGVTVFDVLLIPLLLLAFPLNMSWQIAASHAVRVATMLFCAGLLIPAWGGPGAALAKLSAKVLGALFLGTLILVRLRRVGPVAAEDTA